MADHGDAPGATALGRRGYAVLPAPRRVDLAGGTVRLDAGWHIATEGVGADDIAPRTLIDRLRDEHGLVPGAAGGARRIGLAVRCGAIETGAGALCDGQAYRLSIGPDRIDIVGNAAAGLFYGVQTLLQLADGDGRRTLVLPLGTITDWPRYGLRFVHWDTKHHQDRVETLKRFLDWMARLKLNMVSFELEDKFEYPSHPVIGAPGAFTAAQIEDLVDYGLARHIQIVPNVQAPAHLCYVLKHPEFAHLRCDGSNYQICMDEPEARRLLFDMYDDLCDATRGVEYFHVSTDEVYYAGICEKFRRPYNAQTRSLTWVDYALAAHAHLAARGRQIIIWAEFPLLAEHVALLPRDIINGILGPGVDEAFARAVDARGMGQLAYSPMQGEERLFPNHFAYAERDGAPKPGRLADAYETTLCANPHAAEPIGTFAASWDDAGLHNETFWMGWAVMAQGGWTPGAATLDETVAAFMDIYYGRGCRDMTAVYRLMQDQARFWDDAWDRTPSTVRGPGYGYHLEKTPVRRTDLTLAAPALPRAADLSVEPVYRQRYPALLAEAPPRLAENDRLLALLEENLHLAQRNRYNLEVFRSLARFVRHFIEMLPALAGAEDLLVEAQAADARDDRAGALDRLRRADAKVGAILDGVGLVYADLVRTWEVSRYPRNVAVGAKTFLHVMDDVKDHFADRRPDLGYHTAPLESIGLGAWRDGLGRIIRDYAGRHGLPELLA